MRPKRFFLFLPLGIGMLFLGSWVVMLLWNAILPDVVGVKTLTYWQAMGLLVLSKILFSGGRRGGKPREHWKRRHDFRKRAAWREKWMNMSMEERQKFKQELRERCRSGRWGDWETGRHRDQGKEGLGDQETRRPSDDELL